MTVIALNDQRHAERVSCALTVIFHVKGTLAPNKSGYQDNIFLISI